MTTAAPLSPAEIELGRLAIERRLATREQVRECAQIRSAGSPEHLARLLVSRGYLPGDAARGLVDEVRRRAEGGSQFATPGSAFGTGSNFGADTRPAGVMGQPPSNYAAPPQGSDFGQGFGAPQGSAFSGPSNFGAPASNFNPPGGPSNFGPPASNFGAPGTNGSNFGAPGTNGSNFGAPGFVGSGAHALATAPGSSANTQLPGNISPDDPIAHAMTTRTNKDGTVETVFGPYDILGEIARGGMGIVYRARQRSLKRIVALKVMKEGENASEKQIRRFKRETEAAARLQHPNIVAVHEVGCHEGFHYFTMDLIEGDPLDAIVKRKEKFPVRKVLEVVKETSQAIHYAHDKGIIHRDLKPANVLLDTDGHPKVTDFGLAKQVDHKSMLTRTGAVVGTPFYMPPEQARGDVDLDHRADVYALGVILYELLTLKLPFHGETTMEVYHKILEEDPQPPRKHDSRVDKDVNTIVLKAMDKDCARRYQSAQDLAEDIQRYLDGDPIKARPLGPIGRTIKKARKNMPVVVVSCVVAFAVTASLGLIVWKTRETQREQLEMSRSHEWTQFKTEVENQWINARSQISSAQARMKDRDPQGALADLDDAEQILVDLAGLAPDFTNFNTKEEILAHLEERKPDLDAIMRAVCLERGRALSFEGSASGYAQALEALQRGLNQHCGAPTWGEIDPELDEEEREKVVAARAKTEESLARDHLRLQLEEGKIKALQGRSEEALAIFNQILSTDPRHVDARLEKGRVFDMAGEYLKALTSFSEVIEQDSKTLRAYLLRGGTRYTLGRYEEALEDFNKVLDLKDDSFEGYIWQGRTHQALGHFGEAQESLTEAIDILPSLPDGYLHRANLHFAQRKLPQAIKDYEVAMSRSAQCYEAYLGLGRALEWILDYERAQQQYEEILGSSEREAKDVKARARAALACLQLVRADPFECELEIDAKVRLENASQDGALGATAELSRLKKEGSALSQERLGAALSGLDAAIAADGDLVEARLARARLALVKRDYAGLRAQVERSLEILKRRPEVLFGRPEDAQQESPRTDEWESEGWDEEGGEEVSLRARGDQPLAQAHALLGLASLQEGKLGEARKSFRAALEADSGNALAKSGLGHVRHQEKDAASAKEAFGEARSLQRGISEEAGYFFSEGQRFTELALRSKKPEFFLQARQSFARARAYNPLHALSSIERARLCAEWGSFDVAVQAAEEAVALDPYLREGYELLGFLFTRDLPLERDEKTHRPEHVRDAQRGKAEFDRAVEVASEGEDAEGRFGRALALSLLAGAGEGGTLSAESRALLEAARSDLQRSILQIPVDFSEAEPRAINQSIDYLKTYAEVCRRLGDEQAAKDALERVERVHEKAIEASKEQLSQGRALRDRLNYSEAIKRFDRAIELDPKNDKAYYDRGTCYLKIGNFVPGILDFSRALELNPRIADQVYNKVYQISYVVDLNRVITELNKIVSDHPNVSYVVFLRGFFYVAKTEFKQVSREDLELGIADFVRTLELNPTHVTALLYRGFLWMKMAGRESDLKERDACYARAMKDYEDALVLDPESGISHYLQALLWSVRSAEEGISEEEAEARRKRSLAELKKSFDSEFKGYERIRNERGFAPVKDLPEFKQLMQGK